MIDPTSPSWIFVKQWAESRLAGARLELEEKALPMPETEYQRAAIRVLKDLLALPIPPPEFPTSDQSYT